MLSRKANASISWRCRTSDAYLSRSCRDSSLMSFNAGSTGMSEILLAYRHVGCNSSNHRHAVAQVWPDVCEGRQKLTQADPADAACSGLDTFVFESQTNPAEW